MDGRRFNYEKPIGVQRTHERIAGMCEGKDTLKLDNFDLADVSRHFSKMPDRFGEDHIQGSMDFLFSLAKDRMESEHDKEVLGGLRQMVRELEMTLYRP
jgi:hypothetical protein